MAKQYIRNVEAVVNGVRIFSDGDTGLKLKFGTRQAVTSTPHLLNLIVTNPAPQTIAQMRKEKAEVTLRAGYADGDMGLIFKGQVLQVRNGRENITDTYAHVIATSGEDARNYATVSKALAAGHTYKDRIDLAIEAMKPFGVRPGFIDDFGSKKFPRNYVAHGMAHDLLREVCRSFGASWWIQGDKVNLLKAQNTTPGSVHVINAETGMVGLPEQTIEGVIVKVLLNYNIKPGDKVQINNSSIQQAALNPSYRNTANELYAPGQPLGFAADGIYKVWRVEHEGDTRGNEYHSTVTATAKELPSALKSLVDVPSAVDQAAGG